MHSISTARLRDLEVINLCGGEKLGYPCDFELDIDDARILAMVVEGVAQGFALFSEREQYVIPWRYIECIGEDAILVRLDGTRTEECRCADKRKRRQKCK